MSVVLMIFLACGALSVYGIAVAAFLRWPVLVLYAVAGFTLAAWEFPAIPTLVNLGFVQIKPEDVVVITALSTVIFRPKQALDLTRPYNPLLILVAISLVCALLIGAFRFGPSALNEFRGFLWPIGLTAWLLNQNWQDEKWVQSFYRCSRITALGLSALFATHAAIYGLGSSDSFVTTASGVEQTGRPLVSSQALMLVLVGFLEFRGKRRYGSAPLGVLFILLGILCQHRSVWAAFGLVFVLVFLRLRDVALARVVVGGFYAFVIGLGIWASGALDDAIATLGVSAQSAGTYNARVDTWQQLVDDSVTRGIGSIVFGEPFGFGYDRYDDGRLLTFAPHNWYVSVYLRLGLIGLGLYLILLLAMLGKLLRLKEYVPGMVFVAVLVYSWSYSLSWYLVPVLGFAMAKAMAVRLDEGSSANKVRTRYLGTHYDLFAKRAGRKALVAEQRAP